MYKKGVCLAFLLFLLALPLLGQSTSSSVVELYYSGRKAQDLGDYYTALEIYKSCLEINRNYIGPIIGLAEIYMALEEYEEALKYLQRAKILDSGNTELWVLEGRINIGLENYSRAEQLFSSVVQREPYNQQAQLGFAEIALAQGKLEAARIKYNDALRMNPENKKALLSLVLLLGTQKDYVLAEKYLNLVLSIYPTSEDTRYIAASYYLLKGNLREAENHVLFLLTENPENNSARNLYISILMATGRFREVIPVAESLLKKDRSNPQLWYSLGQSYLETGSHQKAINSFLTAVALKPEDEISRAALEYSVMDTTEIRSAQRQSIAAYHFNKGRGYQERNLTAKALLEYRRGLMIDPSSKEGRIGYARIFKQQGLPAKYLEELMVLKTQGSADRDINDEIEITRSRLSDSVTNSWSVDQYMYEKSSYSFSVFTNPIGNNLDYFGGEIYLRRLFTDYLKNYQNIMPKIHQRNVTGFGDAFRSAREAGTDYFIILSFSESERFFTVTVKTYLTSTGTLLSETKIQRTGNDKIQEALWRSADNIHRELPVFGRILKRNFNSVLIDLGSRDGISPEDNLLVIKNRTLILRKDSFGYEYLNGDILGSVLITGTDEMVSEGEVKIASFFDLINPGDFVIFEIKKEPEAPVQPETPKGLLRTILRLP